MPTYPLVRGDGTQVTQETFDDVELEREDGWLVFFRGRDAVLRIQKAHVRSLDIVASGDADS